MLKLADLQSHGALVLGAPMRPGALDFTGLEAEMRFNGEVAAQTRGANTAGSLEWLLEARQASSSGICWCAAGILCPCLACCSDSMSMLHRSWTCCLLHLQA